MQIKYIPQRFDSIITYDFNGESITVTLNGVSDIFNFADISDGSLESVETILTVNPIISASRINGELKIELLYYCGGNATHEELYPTWGVI